MFRRCHAFGLLRRSLQGRRPPKSVSLASRLDRPEFHRHSRAV
ncbi:uncharacterized protein BCN122_II2911 [Burkholderia cenocepacia]|nr:uncharacterized protein BCN122_II2911 [Burkholderia cenocepacia]